MITLWKNKIHLRLMDGILKINRSMNNIHETIYNLFCWQAFLEFCIYWYVVFFSLNFEQIFVPRYSLGSDLWYPEANNIQQLCLTAFVCLLCAISTQFQSTWNPCYGCAGAPKLQLTIYKGWFYSLYAKANTTWIPQWFITQSVLLKC